MNYEEIYLSLDIEADGRVPGISSMLSFGLAAYDMDKNYLGSFERNLDLLPNAKPHPETEKFWEDNQEAYDITRINMVKPYDAMMDCSKWINDIRQTFKGKPTVVGYPATFDYMFYNWYMCAFLGNNAMGFGALDVKSYAMAMLKKTFRNTTKRAMPREWFDAFPHTHVAIEDSLEQGALTINMIRANLGLERIIGVKAHSKAIEDINPGTKIQLPARR
ncbi:MAG: exonuclease [Gammaproteobacteria bacterium]|nr:exonuclease [Gammaproteobacteria bacterium]